jgi:hypothetical protein
MNTVKLQVDKTNPIVSVEAITEAFRERVHHLHFPKEHMRVISELEDYIDLCTDEIGKFRCTNMGCHGIRMGGAMPIKKNIYKVPYALRDEMEEHDFGVLNAVTQTPVYPILDVKLNLSLMAGSRYFTLIDIEIENAY